MITRTIVILIIVLFSMVLHELAHGWTAYALGDDTAKMDGRLTLNPLKHLDPVLSILIPLSLLLSGGPVFGGAKPVPVTSSRLKGGPWGMALVALAGPLMNFILAFIFFLIGHFTGVLYNSEFLGTVFAQLISINLGFAIFNLIPIPPLDGSRILYAIAPDPIRVIFERLEPIGMIIVMLLVVFASSFISTLMTTAMSAILTCFFRLVGVPL